MKLSTIAAVVVLLALAGSGFAQQVSFDFEDADLAALEAAGWVFIDDENEYLDTITLETEIVHSGTQALRLGAQDIAWFPTDGQFGTLELWAYDYGWKIQDYFDNAYGPRWGLRKTMDVDCTPYFNDGSEPYDHGIVEAAYGIGAGMVQKTFLGSDGGYGAEWGHTQDQNISTIASPDWEIEPGEFIPNAGWAGDQSWWSPSWFRYLGAEGRVQGWYKWRIAYTAPGEVEITLLEGPAGVSTGTGDPGDAGLGAPFDGTVEGGVSDICLYGGSTMVSGREPELEFGDGIFDDITWTPVDTGPTLQADFDGDGDVDLDDFAILKQGFGNGTTHAEGDADGDGDVDLDDFAILKQEFGQAA